MDIFLTRPDFFRIDYAINPHMKNAEGRAHSIDASLATEQWNELCKTLKDLGLKVQVLDADSKFPDMVFCANQCLPVYLQSKIQFLVGKMAHPERQGEELVIKDQLEKLGFETVEITNSPFEGAGDALWSPQKKELWGGYGYRTGQEVYDELEELLDMPVERLKLVDERFYHLDTCLCLLNEESALYVAAAFETDGVQKLKSHFNTLIEVNEIEAVDFLACNAFSPNGVDVLIEEQAIKTSRKLTQLGFKVHPIPTSEFLKAGGSVFCMKQFIPKWMHCRTN